jgi:hypothetical protein
MKDMTGTCSPQRYDRLSIDISFSAPIFSLYNSLV